MESKVIPLSDKGWILKLPTERRGGISKEDVNSLYAEYYPGETLDL